MGRLFGSATGRLKGGQGLDEEEEEEEEGGFSASSGGDIVVPDGANGGKTKI